MLYSILIVIHIIVSIFLIVVILLQAGRGGGLADSFGGSQMQNLFGTKSTNILTKATTACAIVFIFTCLSLAIISSYQSKSVMDKVNIPQTAKPIQSDVDKNDENQESASQAQEKPQEATGEAE